MKILKPKYIIICSIFILILLVNTNSISNISSNNQNTKLPTPADNSVSEGITNGGFETGDLAPWYTGGTYQAYISNDVNYVAHSGSYGAQLMSYGGGIYHPSWIQQNLTDKVIFSNQIVNFTFWQWTLPNIRVTITYWDNSETTQVFSGHSGFQQHLITNFTEGERLRSVRFETLTSSGVKGGIDDVALLYTPSPTLEGITNGGFETGNLSPWTTGGTHQAYISNDVNYVAHSGNYGAQLMSYGGGIYNPSWIQQNLTDKVIFSDDILNFTFWQWTLPSIRVTITYWDNSSTNQVFSGYSGFQQHSITNFTEEERLRSVRFETLTSSGVKGGIDDVSLLYSSLHSYTFSLSSDAEEPVTNGSFTLSWTAPYGVDNYSVYQSNVSITMINESMDLLANEITDLTLPISGYINGTYHFIAVAHSPYGDILSNCISVIVFYPLQGITNGGFETGDLAPWYTGGTYEAYISDDVNYVAYSGNYGAQLMSYGGGHYNPSWIQQNLTDKIIFSDDIISFTFWQRTLPSIRITITYWDNSNTTQVFSGYGGFVQHSITNFTEGKRFRSVRFETLSTSGTKGGIDDVSLLYTPSPTLEGITNGGFETGDLAPWYTGDTYEAYISNDTNYVAYSGSYGAQLMSYGGGQYNPSWIQQNFYNKVILSDEIINFTFWQKTLPSIRVTITYWDNSNTTQIFNGYAGFVQHSITNFTKGKRLRSIRFETLSTSSGKGGIDDVSLQYVCLHDYTFSLSSDAGNPDINGSFILSWTNSSGANDYSLFRYSDYITEINGSLTLLAYEITDLALPLSGYTNGTYYFIAVADTSYGDVFSNCISILVEIPYIDRSFILSSDAGNPDTNGSFTLSWTNSYEAINYSVYRYSDYITEINGSLTLLANEITDLVLPLSGYTNGTYFFIAVAHSSYGDTLSNCISILVGIPSVDRSFILSSDAGNPDTDGSFNLSWTNSYEANNYSVYRYSDYITEINGSLTLLTNDITNLTLPLSGYTNGTYYFIVVAYSYSEDTLSNCISILVGIPSVDRSFTLSSNAGNPDTNGSFTLSWTISTGANSYSVYQNSAYITQINGNLTQLANDITNLALPLSGYTNGTYYFIAVAHSTNGDTLSNCISVTVEIPPESGVTPAIPGYNLFVLLAFLGVSIIYLLRKNLDKKTS